MGQTVTKSTKCKDIDILKKVLEQIFGWKKIEVLTPKEEAMGKSLGTSLYGGIKGNRPVVMKVKKENLTDKEGRKAVWSDFAVTRSPDGTLEIQSDLHNFDVNDKVLFVTDDMIAGVNAGYATESIDTHINSFNTMVVQDWHEEGDNLEKVIEIDEDELPNIPQANYL